MLREEGFSVWLEKIIEPSGEEVLDVFIALVWRCSRYFALGNGH